MKSRDKRVVSWLLVAAFAQALALLPAGAQTEPAAGDRKEASAELQARLQAITESMEQVQRQMAASAERMAALQAEVANLRQQLEASKTNTSSSEALGEAVQQIREQSEVHQAEIKQQEQSKIESSSRFPVKMSGLLLFTAGLNDGAVDDIDDPVWALPRTNSIAHGSFAATMRQTILGLEAAGPHFANARTSGDIHVDFFGSSAYAGGDTNNGGVLRLRTAHVNVDWARTSLSAAYDAPLILPLQPTSLVSQGVPGLAWSGNLWTWSPQVEWRYTRSAGPGSARWQLGLIDPAPPALSTIGKRQPTPGEKNRQPGYESRISYAFGTERSFGLGAGGYYARQKYAYEQHVDAWAVTADWKAPIGRFVELSGEFYRGRAIAGLGGGSYKDYIYNANSYRVQGLDAIGGWAQVKARLTQELEANAALGWDQSFGSELRHAVLDPAAGQYFDLARNRTGSANLIFKPRAYLSLSAEYRNIRTWRASGPAAESQTFGLGAGYIF